MERNSAYVTHGSRDIETIPMLVGFILTLLVLGYRFCAYIHSVRYLNR
jgi:hypothetical protein